MGGLAYQADLDLTLRNDEQVDRLAETRLWLVRLIEVAWLSAVILVPLAFAPPGWFAFFEIPKIAIARAAAGAIVMLWTADIALAVWRDGLPRPSTWGASARAWLAAEPMRWTVVLALVYLGIVTASTIASAVPSVSIWGFEYGREGQSLASVGSLVVLFLAVTFRLQTPGQMWRLFAAIVGMGLLVSLYALAQHLDIDPWHLSRVFPGRVIGTLRNPIFLGSSLVLVLPLTMIAALLAWRWSGRWAVGVASSAVGGLVLFMLAMTFARGPGATAIAAMLALAALLLLGASRTIARSGLVVIAITVALAGLGLVAIPADDSALTEGDATALDAVGQRAGSIPAEFGGGLSARYLIWRTSADLVAERPWFEFEDGRPTLVRHMLGYGPDTFLYVFPMGGAPTERTDLHLEVHAHNQWVHAAVEIGVLGALALLAFTVLPWLAGAHVLLFRAHHWPVPYRILLIGILAALAGRAIEQMVGFQQVSDSVLFWAMTGMLVALPRIVAPTPQTPARAANVGTLPVRAAVVVVMSVILVATAMLTAQHTYANVFGARDAALSVNATREEGDLLKGLELVNSAIAKAPVGAYRVRAIDLLSTFRVTTYDVDDVALIEGALVLAEGGLDHNPLNLELNIRAAEQYIELYRRGRTDLAETAALAFERVAGLFPAVRNTQRTAGVRLLELGMPARAVPWLERGLAITPDGNAGADSLYMLGIAYRDLGRHDDAMATLAEAQAMASPGNLRNQIEAMIEFITPVAEG